MTYLQLVNSVLRRLRENEVDTVPETSYSVLIGDFVNDAKQLGVHLLSLTRLTVRLFML